VKQQARGRVGINRHGLWPFPEAAEAGPTGLALLSRQAPRQIGGELPVVPLAGVSSVAQLEENLAAVDLELSSEQRARLDAAY
jgi:aryl-alcohol dehydrogenase-like predicted oxidoreductase